MRPPRTIIHPSPNRTARRCTRRRTLLTATARSPASSSASSSGIRRICSRISTPSSGKPKKGIRRKERRGHAERKQKNAHPLRLVSCFVKNSEWSFLARLLVAEGLDRVEPGGLHGGEPATNHADDNQDGGGEHHGDERERKLDVHFAGIVFVSGAEEGQRANRGSDGCREQHADYACRERHDQRFQQELPANVRFFRTERAAQPYFADAFVDGDHHDIHHAYTADAQREGANKKEQRFYT